MASNQNNNGVLVSTPMQRLRNRKTHCENTSTNAARKRVAVAPRLLHSQDKHVSMNFRVGEGGPIMLFTSILHSNIKQNYDAKWQQKLDLITKGYGHKSTSEITQIC